MHGLWKFNDMLWFIWTCQVAPSCDNQLFNVRLIYSSKNPEIAILSPWLSPGIGSNPKFFFPPLGSSQCAPSSEFDCMCPKLSIFFWFFICTGNMSIYSRLIMEEILIDLHYGLNWSIVHDFSHYFSFIGRDSVWRRTLVDPIRFLDVVGTWLCGMPFSPPIRPACHGTAIIGNILILEKWIACVGYQSTFSQVPPSPIDASTITSMTVLGTARNQILRG